MENEISTIEFDGGLNGLDYLIIIGYLILIPALFFLLTHFFSKLLKVRKRTLIVPTASLFMLIGAFLVLFLNQVQFVAISGNGYRLGLMFVLYKLGSLAVILVSAVFLVSSVAWIIWQKRKNP